MEKEVKNLHDILNMEEITHEDKMEFIKKEINSFDELKNKLFQMQEELLQIPEVREFNELSEENEKIDKLKTEYMVMYQRICTHPIWAVLFDCTSDFSSKEYWRCKCIKCKYEKHGESSTFKNAINNPISKETNKPISFEQLCSEYETLKTTKAEEEVCSEMIKKYKMEKNN